MRYPVLELYKEPETTISFIMKALTVVRHVCDYTSTGAPHVDIRMEIEGLAQIQHLLTGTTHPKSLYLWDLGFKVLVCFSFFEVGLGYCRYRPPNTNLSNGMGMRTGMVVQRRK